MREEPQRRGREQTQRLGRCMTTPLGTPRSILCSSDGTRRPRRNSCVTVSVREPEVLATAANLPSPLEELMRLPGVCADFAELCGSCSSEGSSSEEPCRHCSVDLSRGAPGSGSSGDGHPWAGERIRQGAVDVAAAGTRLVSVDVPGARYQLKYVLYAFNIIVDGEAVHSFEQRYSVLRRGALACGAMRQFPGKEPMKDMTDNARNVKRRHQSLGEWLEHLLRSQQAAAALRCPRFQSALGLS
eukprot:TRINITY_DN4142_c0_g1_i1.p1 TRINITY_DN4142_c0_g1~~TRINITY_DN4142_c0_g1_i1.p1  ORF type:complete len:273 (+),score=49.43 TRINITY_DN4142_c0_g1_i1:93-821(+)